MSQAEFTLAGWKAALVLAIAAAAGAYGLFMRQASLDTQGREVVRAWIASEYTGKALSKWEGTDYAKDDQLAAQSVQEILAAARVEIPSVKARGGKRETVVRVEILVDGKPPADGQGVRYYKMKFYPVSGWSIGRRVSAFSYYSKLF